MKEFGDAIQVLDQSTPNGKVEYNRPPQVLKNPVSTDLSKRVGTGLKLQAHRGPQLTQTSPNMQARKLVINTTKNTKLKSIETDQVPKPSIAKKKSI